MSNLSRRTLLRAAGIGLGGALLPVRPALAAAPAIPQPRTATVPGTVDVRAAGAVGDGVADDTGALRRRARLRRRPRSTCRRARTA